MENNTALEQSSGKEDNSSAIFGTSSDAIVQGLHNGAYVDPEDLAAPPNPGDSSKIVNEQEQNEIVNPDEEDFTTQTPDQPSNAATAEQNQGIPSEVIEGDTIDDGIDDEEETLKARS